jgi:thiosulfate reductase cytochrome b subunit
MKRARLVTESEFSITFHKVGFWIIVAMLIGFIAGNTLATARFASRLSDCATYKAIKIGDMEYDLKERI